MGLGPGVVAGGRERSASEIVGLEAFRGDPEAIGCRCVGKGRQCARCVALGPYLRRWWRGAGAGQRIARVS